MKRACSRAYQIHYEAAMSKVLREEARRIEKAKEAKKNKKRKLLPVVEDPVVKIDRRKLRKGKGKSSAAATEDVSHPGFVIKLKGNIPRGDINEIDVETKHVQSSIRSSQRYLPGLLHGPPPGETLTPSEQKAYDRIAKSTEKRFDTFIAAVWKDIAKKDIPKAFRQMDTSLKVKQSNAKKTVQLAAKEARRWQARSTKASKEMQIKSKKAMREVLYIVTWLI